MSKSGKPENRRPDIGQPPLSIDAPRRQFIGQVVAGAATVAAAACTRAQVAAQAVSPATAPSTGHPADSATAAAREPKHPDWDLSWVNRIAGQHRQVFDAPEIAEGTVLHQTRMFLRDYKDVYHLTDADLRAVLVVRHRAVPMILSDAIWERYDFIGRKFTKLKDPTTGKWARRNPFLNAKDGDAYALIWPDGGLDTLIGQGAIVLACNLATMAFAGIIAKRVQKQPDDVKQELRDGLVPGVTLVPSGVFAVIRSEEAGCNYLRAT